MKLPSLATNNKLELKTIKAKRRDNSTDCYIKMLNYATLLLDAYLNLLYSQIQEGQFIPHLNDRLWPFTSHGSAETTIEFNHH